MTTPIDPLALAMKALEPAAKLASAFEGMRDDVIVVSYRITGVGDLRLAREAYRLLKEMEGWRPMNTAPKDGTPAKGGRE